MKKSIEELAEEYCVMKQKQALGQFSDHELFIIKLAFMAGHTANKSTAISDEEIEQAAYFEGVKIHGKTASSRRVHFVVGFKHGVNWVKDERKGVTL